MKFIDQLGTEAMKYLLKTLSMMLLSDFRVVVVRYLRSLVELLLLLLRSVITRLL
jgi:hypothetical protein